MLEANGDQEFILGSLFVIANKLQMLLDREFKSCGLTVKQWFLSIIIGGVFAEPPTLSDAAAVMGSTHQNVKQVALKLKEKGFVEFIDDPDDGRALRLRLTKKSDELWAGMQERSKSFMEELYKGIGSDGLAAMRALLGMLMANIDEMDAQAGQRSKM
jgi:DNA-binding MarR family transcriptional regulator